MSSSTSISFELFRGKKPTPVTGRTRGRNMRPATRLRAVVIEALETRALLSALPLHNSYGYTAQDGVAQASQLAEGQPGVVKIIAGKDEKLVAIDLGGNAFTFFGTRYTGDSQLFVSTDGLITFGQGVNERLNNDQLNVPPGFGFTSSPAAIAPLWDDWTTTEDSLSEDGRVLARLDADQLTIQWDEVHHSDAFRNAFSPTTATFQAVLSLNTPNDGKILFNYINLNTGDDTTEGNSATIGIRNADPSPDPLIVSYNGSDTAVGTGKSILIAPASHAPTPPTVSAAQRLRHRGLARSPAHYGRARRSRPGGNAGRPDQRRAGVRDVVGRDGR